MQGTLTWGDAAGLEADTKNACSRRGLPTEVLTRMYTLRGYPSRQFPFSRGTPGATLVTPPTDPNVLPGPNSAIVAGRTGGDFLEGPHLKRGLRGRYTTGWLRGADPHPQGPPNTTLNGVGGTGVGLGKKLRLRRRIWTDPEVEGTILH